MDDIGGDPAALSSSATTDAHVPPWKRNRRFNVRPYATSSKRVVSKRGRKNVALNEVPDRDYRYAKDIGNTLVGARWRWILACLCLVNAVFYLVFAIAWWLIAFFNDDVYNDGSKSPPCIVGTKTFTGYLLLSIETLTTTGYGIIYPTECQPCWIVLTLQTMTTFVIEGLLVSAVFVKMTRPFNKDSTSLFSKKAVISMRDGALCLIFRVRDVYGKHWAKTTVKAVMVRQRTSSEGEVLPHYFVNLKLEKHGMLFWPQEVIHRITSDSALWTTSPSNIYKSRFEVIVVLEGDSTTTGQPSQSQTSYTNREISWGYRFAPCLTYDQEQLRYVVDHDKFNEVKECDTPLCSASELSYLLNEALRRNETATSEWSDWDISPSLSTPLSRVSDTSFRTLLKFSNYRKKRQGEQLDVAPLETIESVENLADAYAGPDGGLKSAVQILDTTL